VANTVQIKCINRTERMSPHERITHVGGYVSSQWKITWNARPLGGAQQSGFACSVLFWHSYECSRAGFLRPWPFANPTNLSLSP
jgi:hypothetical protein